MPATPNVQNIINKLNLMFPGQLRFETFNRRHIGNNPRKPWSQHAGNEPKHGFYGNAVDIFDPRDSYLSALLDQVNDYLRANRHNLEIRVILWRVSNHYDHIHVDTWPMMEDDPNYVPPPSGELITIHPNGARDNTFLQNPEQEDYMIQQGATGNTVKKMQQGLNGWIKLFREGRLDPLDIDGVYGEATATIVAEYQEAADLPIDSTYVSGVMYASLLEYVPDWIENHPEAADLSEVFNRLDVIEQEIRELREFEHDIRNP